MKIIKPLVTEKTLREYKTNHVVTFVVSDQTNKTQAKQELSKLFDVKVIGVQTSVRLGKTKYNRLTKRFGRTTDRKIMVFKLDPKNKLDMFEVK